MKTKRISKGGAGGKGIEEIGTLTKTDKALYSTAEEKFVPGWGNGDFEHAGFGPQSNLAEERRKMSPRKVPIGRGVAGARR